MQDVSSNPGVYGSEAWPSAQTWWGALGLLSIAGGLITSKISNGDRSTMHWRWRSLTRGGVYASPAERTDGKNTEARRLPEGAHLRLEPNLNLAALHLPRLTLMIAEAAQRYGIFVRDTGANGPTTGRTRFPPGPNRTPGRRLLRRESAPRLLASFPWSELELLKMELHSTS